MSPDRYFLSGLDVFSLLAFIAAGYESTCLRQKSHKSQPEKGEECGIGSHCIKCATKLKLK